MRCRFADNTDLVLAAIGRIVNAEAEASGAPRKPEITPLGRYPLDVNGEALVVGVLAWLGTS